MTPRRAHILLERFKIEIHLFGWKLPCEFISTKASFLELTHNLFHAALFRVHPIIKLRGIATHF